AITGNVPVDQLGRDSFQEIDITGVTMPITKHNFIVKDVTQLADTVRKAFEIAKSGRPGPVLIDIPKDVSAAVTEYEKAGESAARPVPAPKEERVELALDVIASCEKPLIYFGGGVISSGAEDVLLRFAEEQQIPVCSSMMGLGGFAPSHPLWLGMVGMHGTRAANLAAKECDALFVCGARFSDRVAGDRKGFAPNAKVIHIDVDHAEFDKNVTATVRVGGDLKTVLEALCERSESHKHEAWCERVASMKTIKPVAVQDPDDAPDPRVILETLRSLVDEDTVVATDVGQHQMWTAQHFEVRRPRKLLTSGGLGTMGYGMGAAIGAQCGTNHKRTVLITGDGSFHMNCNELATLVSYQLPVTVLVFNNRVLGMVRQWQKVFYGRRFSATDPERRTDFVKLANAYGCEGMALTRAADVECVLKEALAADGPVLVDCRLSKDVNVLPMIPPGKTVDNMIESME
ncbi:MAG: biosynthetic-type acetolactate synthase large subunit, partial [Clostridia bacterium]|nr:biosynthetic-type acetolactate synthase large subunit [Clostridia bacterium]